MSLAVALLALALVAGADGPCPPAETVTPEEPTITTVYPDTNRTGNVGEYVGITFPRETALGNWTLTDGHTRASLPGATKNGTVAATLDPVETARFTDATPVALEGHLRLAADGDDIALEYENETVDSVSYDRATTGERWYRTGPEPTDGDWWPRGGTCRAPVSATPGEVTVFLLPDEPDVPLETLEGARERVYLGAYTLTEPGVVDTLADAADDGVEVRVLLEASPVGGRPAGTEAAVATLEAAGANVRAIGGGDDRYTFHHPKYAVVDETVLVTTENWVESGVGGAGNRGWGVVLEDSTLAAELAAVFMADADGWDTESAVGLEDVDDDPPPTGSFPTEHDTESVPVERAEIVLGPDAAAPHLEELLAGAEESIHVVQPRIPDPEFSLLQATLAAARNGTSVTILLDASWYVEEENEATAAALEDVAAAEDLDLEVHLDDPEGYDSIHAKGLVVDDVAVVGSLNWNDNSLLDNREILVTLHSDAAAAYFRSAIEADIAGAGWSLPLDVVGVVLVCLTAVGVHAARTLVFAPDRE